MGIWADHEKDTFHSVVQQNWDPKMEIYGLVEGAE